MAWVNLVSKTDIAVCMNSMDIFLCTVAAGLINKQALRQGLHESSLHDGVQGLHQKCETDLTRLNE